MFDVVDHLDELRCWPTDRLSSRRAELVREQRRLHIEELTITRVLDERGQIDATIGRDGESARTVRDQLETARALESLPAVAAAAHEGRLSDDQLNSVVRLADETSDAEWAARAPNVAPTDLARLARTRTKPTPEEGRARYDARSLRMWWNQDKTMLHLHGQLPDLMGVNVEQTILRLTQHTTAPKGRPWDTFEHRAADALGAMCDAVAVAERVETPSMTTPPLLVVQVPQSGPAEIAGIPLPDAMVEQLRASARIEPVLIDDHGLPTTIGRQASAVSTKILRAVMLRDGHCRIPGCENNYGLHAHHLRPRSWDGTDDASNLAMTCVAAGHHQMLIPHGPWALLGNPNQPDGLELVHIDDLNHEHATQLGLPSPRAGPHAA